MTYFRCLQGPHDNGTRLRFRTTLYCGSGGDCPELDEVVEGGVAKGMAAAVVVVWRGYSRGRFHSHNASADAGEIASRDGGERS